MELALKGIKVFKAGSEETTNFVATLYVNGKRAAEVRNDGQGGSNRYHFADPKVRDAVEAFVATQPGRTYGTHVARCDLDDLVDDLLAAYEKDQARKKLVRQATKKVHPAGRVLLVGWIKDGHVSVPCRAADVDAWKQKILKDHTVLNFETL